MRPLFDFGEGGRGLVPGNFGPMWLVVPDCLLLIADSGVARRDGLASVGRQLGF